jgi:Family of unknown function (DUF6510)
MDALKLDGNAAAGMLQEVFALEVTAAAGTCDGCGAVGAVGALMLYAHTHAPGLVLRCPHCEAVVLRLVTDGKRYWLDTRGLRSLELTA